jgi:two-component system cell cycle sensor histidine kinase/response regulator CckA
MVGPRYAHVMEPTPEAIRSITHDLRNLLTAVRGHADLALRGLSSEDPAREDVAHVVVVTAAVFELVDQLDGVDASDTQITVGLDGSVASMRRLLDALLPNHIEMHLAPDSDQAHVAISKLRIERIVLNLALNARDAMPDGGRLSITTQPGSAGTVQIIVSDTGPGFSEDALEHLFEIGYSTKRESGGSGHGLSAVARFVDGAGGSVEVESVAGEGATIIVSLPTAEVEDFSVSDTSKADDDEITEAGDSTEAGETAKDGEIAEPDELSADANS